MIATWLLTSERISDFASHGEIANKMSEVFALTNIKETQRVFSDDYIRKLIVRKNKKHGRWKTFDENRKHVKSERGAPAHSYRIHKDSLCTPEVIFILYNLANISRRDGQNLYRIPIKNRGKVINAAKKQFPNLTKIELSSRLDAAITKGYLKKINKISVENPEPCYTLEERYEADVAFIRYIYCHLFLSFNIDSSPSSPPQEIQTKRKGSKNQ